MHFLSLCRKQPTWTLGIGFFLFYILNTWNLPITDPVESNYALTAMEMLNRGQWLSPLIYGQPWFDKPILTYWVLMLSFKCFGFSDWAARLPFSITAVGSILLMYYSAIRITANKKLAVILAIMTGTSLEFWYISHAILTDGLLFFFSLGIFTFAYLAFQNHDKTAISKAYVCAALAVLTKGPVGIVLPGIILIVFLLIRKNKSTRDWKLLFDPRSMAYFLIIALPWYASMYTTYGQAFIDGFLGLHNYIRATIPEHPNQNWWFLYLIEWPLSTLPWTGLTIYELIYGKRSDWQRYLLTWGLLVYGFYTLMATKYITYTFIGIIPFLFLSAQGLVTLQKRLKTNHQIHSGLWCSLPVILLIGLVAGALWWVPQGTDHILLLLGSLISLALAVFAWTRKNPITLFASISASAICFFLTLTFTLTPIISASSGQALWQATPNKNRAILYYFEDYRTSLSYYSGQPMYELSTEPETFTNVWDKGKNIMPFSTLNRPLNQLKVGQYVVIYVADKHAKAFKASAIYDKMKALTTINEVTIYVPKISPQTKKDVSLKG